MLPSGLPAADPAAESTEAQAIGLAESMGDAMLKQASEVREDLTQQARSLFEREPLGWDLGTLNAIYHWALDLPEHIPNFIKLVIQHSRLLGVAGSLVMLVFLVAVLYSLIGQRRVLRRIERAVEPYRDKISDKIYPFVISGVRIVVAAVIPLVLLAGYSLVDALVKYDAAWFVIAGRLIILWALGALVLNLLRESLTRDLFEVTTKYGRAIYRLVRLVLFLLPGGHRHFLVGQGAPAACRCVGIRPVRDCVVDRFSPLTAAPQKEGPAFFHARFSLSRLPGVSAVSAALLLYHHRRGLFGGAALVFRLCEYRSCGYR